MPRVTVSLTDSILIKADEEANKSGLSRSEYVAKAIESFATGSNQAKLELHTAQLELNKCQVEVMQLGRKISKLENQLSEKDKAIESKAKDVMQVEEKLNQAYADVMQARQEVGKYEMAIKAKEDEVSFLRGHVAQLTQSISQLSLPPSQGKRRLRRKDGGTLRRACRQEPVKIAANVACYKWKEAIQEDKVLANLPLPIQDCDGCEYYPNCEVTEILRFNRKAGNWD